MLFSTLVCAAALLQSSGALAPHNPQGTTNIRYSREQLDKLRARVAAQVAVQDLAEGAMRAPTPEEAAALARTGASTQADVRFLKNGAIAVRGGQSHVEYVIAVQSDDGNVSIQHPGQAQANRKGGTDVR